jgi:stringent starvation protein B
VINDSSTKPYLIRAIYEWCADAGYTPYLAVQVDEYTQVPAGYVKDGQIVLNIGADAVKDLQMGNEDISCSGRFGGVAHQLMIPVTAVIGIFAKETGQGLVFQAGEPAPLATAVPPEDPPAPPAGRPQLKIVK